MQADRLTALDRSFLALEDANVHMHVGSVGIFEGAELVDESGALAFERIRSQAERALRRSPRFRQRIQETPLTDDPVWVDDPRFNLDFHVRHSCLPAPGGIRQLKRLVGRILSQRLERKKPLWEMWFVEGLEERRFAVITKVHHAMIDGISGVDLMAAFMGPEPRPGEPPPSGRWVPRPTPSPVRLLAESIGRRATLPARLLGRSLSALSAPQHTLRQLGEGASDLGEALAASFGHGSDTPLNVAVGPHRRFDWTRFERGAVEEVRARHGGTLNDVAITAATGGLRDLLRRRGVDVNDLDFRALLPVSVRRSRERGKLGNRVAFLLAQLPVDEPDPVRRLARVVEATGKLKRSGQTRGGELLEDVLDEVAPSLVGSLSSWGARRRAFNTVITNVPGPPQYGYLMGARMLDAVPVVPLFSHNALGIALFTYADGLYWGFNADWDAVPDLHDLVEAVQLDFEALRKA